VASDGRLIEMVWRWQHQDEGQAVWPITAYFVRRIQAGRRGRRRGNRGDRTKTEGSAQRRATSGRRAAPGPLRGVPSAPGQPQGRRGSRATRQATQRRSAGGTGIATVMRRRSTSCADRPPGFVRLALRKTAAATPHSASSSLRATSTSRRDWVAAQPNVGEQRGLALDSKLRIVLGTPAERFKLLLDDAARHRLELISQSDV
jgi:hypothetical protein